MKMNIPLSLNGTIVCFLITAICTLTEQPSPAQSIEHRSVPFTQASQEATRESYFLARASAASLHANHYSQAESEARQAMALDPLSLGEESRSISSIPHTSGK
jgi:hypothetical protein